MKTAEPLTKISDFFLKKSGHFFNGCRINRKSSRCI